jgi:hypothetical protein
MKQLQENGVWKIREGELTPGKFEGLDDAQKMTYLFQILITPEDERSTYEKVIMSRYLKGNYSFILDEMYMNMDEPSLFEINLPSTEGNVELPTEQELVDSGKTYLEKYLNVIFKVENPRWKSELKFCTADSFITSTRNYMRVDTLTLLHIKAYKKILLND